MCTERQSRSRRLTTLPGKTVINARVTVELMVAEWCPGALRYTGAVQFVPGCGTRVLGAVYRGVPMGMWAPSGAGPCGTLYTGVPLYWVNPIYWVTSILG